MLRQFTGSLRPPPIAEGMIWRNLLLDGNIVADTAVLSLEPDALGIKGGLGARVEGCATLWVGVVVVILHEY